MKRTLASTFNRHVALPTLSEIARSYLSAALSSLESKADLMRLHILPVLGERRVDQIDDAAVAELAARKLAEGARPKTVNNILSCLRCIQAFAADQGLVESLPRFPWRRTPTARIRHALSEDEARRLVAAADAGWRVMIELGLAGLRLGELLGLRWSDVGVSSGTLVLQRTLVRGRVSAPGKNRPRRVALEDQALAALLAHRRDRGTLVFCNELGTALAADQTRWPLWRACDRAGLPRMGWDALRKRVASSPTCCGAPWPTA